MKNAADTCPIKKIADLLSDTWTILIVRDLLASNRRFCELERSLDGISTRTLTLKLKALSEKDIVEKKDVYYSITKKGKKLQALIDAMTKISI